MLDNVLVSPDGFCDAGAKVYANGRDLKDPCCRLSMRHERLSPDILTSGTRDLLLSNTVRVHRKLRRPASRPRCKSMRNVARALHPHDTAPESKEVFEEIAGFFDKHLGNSSSEIAAALMHPPAARGGCETQPSCATQRRRFEVE